MTVTHAQSLVAGLTVIQAAPDEDRDALTRLAFWSTRYAPLVTPDPPEGLFFDVAGSAHLFRGEAALIDDLIKRLEGAGISARAAVADTPGCAWAVARFSNRRIVPAGRASEAIASLPVAALRLPEETVSSLRDVGIERVAQLASKPRATVPLRFGAPVLTRLDQALGSAEEALVSLIPPEVPRCELRFAEPLGDAQDLQRVIALLAGKLCHELERKGIGARRLDLAFTRVDNIAQAVRVGLSRPNREPKHLAKLLSERLVLIDPGFGIELAALTASWVEALTERQTVGRHVEPDGSDADLGLLIDTLGVRLGPERVYRLGPLESELPERSVRKLPALHPAAGADWPRHLPRPARILAPPERITAVAEMPDHPPRLFVWRKRRHRVRRADGPERILGEWWKSESEIELTRDYFRVETADGGRFWLFRDGAANDGRWWLHGIGDA
jgi:protein ImuB